ncbi:MAG TPA: protein-methionine-sulfoxide reductase catalytic subunit MsrP [Geminicoccaceae bacterium]|nr:protein-methionine-sulfoxide reductase catalytic subunit MsrP [Geminicoccaceae bacterium]
MLIRQRRGWELPEGAATPEAVFLDRRCLIKGLGAGTLIAAASPWLLPGPARAADDPSAHLYPVRRNLRYRVDGEITPAEITGTFNNFFEFGSSKRIAAAAQALEVRPWTVTIDGMVEKEQTIGIDDLLARMPLEERVVRHRCVEAWSMIVPWSGFPMAQLVELARPLGSAKFVEMRTFENPEVAPGQRQFWYPWPYLEGLTIAEATNELAFMVTGAYGKPLPKPNGSPLRLAVPWKYGFKHVKSIVRITFTDRQPVSFWEEIGNGEYGFWANVNPEVPHPRWSQATEERIGTGERIPTRRFNGYEEFVADLYPDLENRALYV